MKYTMLMAFSAAAIALSDAAASQDDYANPHLLIEADVLASAENVLIIDVRAADDFASGHIPGAQQIDPDAVADPSATIPGSLRQTDELVAVFENLGITPETQIVFYDDKGGFHAARMFWLAEYFGHPKVSLLNGGIQAWVASGGKLETGPGEPIAPGDMSPALSPRRFATADWIVEREDDESTLVIDVRPQAAFEKGHIPWARNIPWKGNLGEDGRMKPAGELAAHFLDYGVTKDRNIVVHCQNGLASAHSYVALRLLGYPKVRTYHRSWMEWGSADDLPKAVGPQG